MKPFKRRLLSTLIGFVTLILPFSVAAQSDPAGEKRVTGTYAIIDARAFLAPGKASRTTILIKSGLIEGVGTNLPIPAEAQVIKGDSMFVYPGFIDPTSIAGVETLSAPERPKDFDPSDPAPEFVGITPQKDVLDAFIGGEEIEKWRKAGFTVGQLLPQGIGMLPGQAAVIVFGNKNSSNILRESTGLSMRFQTARGLYPGTILGIMAKWRELYENAKLAAHHQTIFENNQGVVRPERDPVLEAFFPVIEGRMPAIFEAASELEVRRAMALQRENDFDLILSGVKEGTGLIPLIKDTNTKVLLSLDLPDGKAAKKEFKDPSEEINARQNRIKEAYEDALKLAGEFEKGGVNFAFSTQGVKPEEVIKNVRLMIKNGLSEEAALSALTVNAANILGLGQTLGSIEEGKIANLIITGDSLFKEGTEINKVFADGYLFEFETKPTKTKEGTDDILAGSWDYVSEAPEGNSTGTMVLTKLTDGYEGKISYDDPETRRESHAEMENIKWDGKTLEFSYSVQVKDMHITIQINGEVSGEEIIGDLSIPNYGGFPFKATKAVVPQLRN